MPAPSVTLTQIADYGSGTADLMALSGGQITGRHGFDGGDYGVIRDGFPYRKVGGGNQCDYATFGSGLSRFTYTWGRSVNLVDNNQQPGGGNSVDHSDGWATPNANTGIRYSPFADTKTQTFYLYLQFVGNVQVTAAISDGSASATPITLTGPSTRIGIRCIYRGLIDSTLDLRLTNLTANGSAFIAPQFCYKPPATATPHYRGSSR